jgi:uncharacterized protein YjiS (DUF1127 family)
MRKPTRWDELTGLAELGPLGVQPWLDEPLLHLHPRWRGGEPVIVVDVDAWARHADASNGFGAAVADPVSAPDETGQALHQEVRKRRARALGTFIASAARACVALLGDALARYRRHREARRTYDALRQLDDRMLRDLGLDRSEMTSIAAEVSGQAEYARIRSTMRF